MGKRSKVMKAGDNSGLLGMFHGVGRTLYNVASESRLVPNSEIKVGRKVFAKYSKNNLWYPAVVTAVNNDKDNNKRTYDVKYIGDGRNDYDLEFNNIRLLFPDFPDDSTDITDSVVKNRLDLYEDGFVKFDGVSSTPGTITYKKLPRNIITELHRVIDGGYLIGGKSRKQRKSHKNNKSRKNRKSRKDRK